MLGKLLVAMSLLVALTSGADYTLPMGNEYEVSFSLNTTGGEYTEITIGDFVKLDSLSTQSIHLKKESGGSLDIDLTQYNDTQDTHNSANKTVSGYPAESNSHVSDTGRYSAGVNFWLDDHNNVGVRSTFREEITNGIFDSLQIKRVK